MRTRPISILTTTCRRCGKPLATLGRSLYGADEAKGRLDRICDACTTDAIDVIEPMRGSVNPAPDRIVAVVRGTGRRLELVRA